MSDTAINVLVDRLAAVAGERQRVALTGILSYLARSSLPVLRLEESGSQVQLVCGEVDQFMFSVDELLQHWHGLRSGRPINWDNVRRA